MFLYVVVIPVLVYAGGRMIAGHYHLRSNQWLLVLAALLFSVSLFLPSPLIHGGKTQFLTHFFGGGVFVGLLCLYFRPLIKRELIWYEELAILFVLVSAFGVVNELYELFAYETGISSQSVTDTSWDLVANTLGAMTFFIVYKATVMAKRLFISR